MSTLTQFFGGGGSGSGPDPVTGTSIIPTVHFSGNIGGARFAGQDLAYAPCGFETSGVATNSNKGAYYVNSVSPRNCSKVTVNHMMVGAISSDGNFVEIALNNGYIGEWPGQSFCPQFTSITGTGCIMGNNLWNNWPEFTTLDPTVAISLRPDPLKFGSSGSRFNVTLPKLSVASFNHMWISIVETGGVEKMQATGGAATTFEMNWSVNVATGATVTGMPGASDLTAEGQAAVNALTATGKVLITLNP